MNKRAYIKKVIPGRPMLIEIETVDKKEQVSVTREQIVGNTWTTGWHGMLILNSEDQFMFFVDNGNNMLF